MAPRPCIGCGELIDSGSRCPDCKPKRTTTRAPGDIRDTRRWRELSKRLRKLSPFCESCSATADLVCDHIIPVSEDPSLAFEPLNIRVLCRSENARRRAGVTDAERQMVHDRIAAHKARRRNAAASPQS